MTYYGFGNCAKLPAISTFAEAREHLDKTIPIRGASRDHKPAGDNRRYKWYLVKERVAINQYENTEVRSVAYELYGTDCVQFYPNGDLTLRIGGYKSPTTMAFIGYLVRNIGTLISERGKWYFRNRNDISYVFEDDLHLTLKDGVYTAKNPALEYRYSVNRKALNAIRKKYKECVDYGKVMLSMDKYLHNVNSMEGVKFYMPSYRLLSTYHWSKTECENNRKRVITMLDEYLETKDLDLLYHTTIYLALCAGRRDWHRDMYYCEPYSFTKTFDEVLKYEFRDEVFVKEPIDLGVCFADRNAKYFR